MAATALSTTGSDNCLKDLLTVVIISSPCSSHPDTTLIEKVILSLSRFKGLDVCSIIIVLDGYVIRDTERSKKGQITEEMGEQYEEYHKRLIEFYTNDTRIRIYRSDKHLGFAFAVKYGLSLCETTYGLVAQHDRQFIYTFDRLSELIEIMGKNDHMRYIGFPTITNRTHDSCLHSRYNLSYLNFQINLGQDLALQPLIFWFDSQHICHIKRYLEIYNPYVTLSEPLKLWLGRDFVKKMVLRKGDFIEDRFGQAQRRCLTMKGKDDDFMLKEAFQWFGSYLAWIPDDYALTSDDGRGACVMVGHLRGRQLNPKKIKVYRADASIRLQKRAEIMENYEDTNRWNELDVDMGNMFIENGGKPEEGSLDDEVEEERSIEEG
jgi:hypothetical protein